MGLACQGERRVADTAGIALDFLDGIAGGAGAIQPDTWHRGDAPEDVLFEGVARP